MYSIYSISYYRFRLLKTKKQICGCLQLTWAEYNIKSFKNDRNSLQIQGKKFKLKFFLRQEDMMRCLRFPSKTTNCS